ncbi:MAG: hypothetical protein ACXWPS_16980 [Ktedonobacteraceae bacterium]
MYGEVLEVDQSVVIGIVLVMAIRRTVVLIVKRQLVQAIEILRYAQDDKEWVQVHNDMDRQRDPRYAQDDKRRVWDE